MSFREGWRCPFGRAGTHPDFSNLTALTAQIERAGLQFIADVEGFLAAYDN
jgi:hypothetical protein